jgi:hypothetical protein
MEEESQPTERKRPYTVWVYDNFHYMDPEESYCAGEFDQYEDALARSWAIVDDFLLAEYTPGMTPDDLYRVYTTFGDDPSISPPEPGKEFSAWRYARQRCEEMCVGQDRDTPTSTRDSDRN